LAGLRYFRLTRLPRHDRGPAPGGNRSAASCLCTVLGRALYHYATRSPVGIPRWRLVLIGISFATVQGASLQYGCFGFLMSQVAHSEGGKSSRTSGWIICAMTGWACLSCMIFVISRINASGSSTNAWLLRAAYQVQ